MCEMTNPRRWLAAFYALVQQMLLHAVSVVGWPGRRFLLNREEATDAEQPRNTALECQPIRTLDELLNICSQPIAWHSLVEPYEPSVRRGTRQLGAKFTDFDADDVVGGDAVGSEEERPKVLVCHDLAGNYRGDRFVNGSAKWDDYRFYHWSGIDLFCYFSHSFITIPTLGWLQAAHRHGVRVLGTIITEGSDGRRNLLSILATDATIEATVAGLVHLAQHLQFEGWLLNVECSLPKAAIPRLRRFVELLHERMHRDVPHASVIWYDSILASGDLRWQNELNLRNRQFFDACDGILLNYNWNATNLRNSCQLLDNNPRLVAKIFAGIDVFGRGQVAGFRTHETWARIQAASANMSVGLFAPGWTFEASAEHGVNIHTVFGTDLCNAAFVTRNSHFWNRIWPLLSSHAAGRLPFASSFCLGSGKRRHCDGVAEEPPRRWFNLQRQQWQPSVAADGAWRLQFADAFEGGACLEVQPGWEEGRVWRLFVTDFRGADVAGGVIVSYAFKALLGSAEVAVWLRLRAQDEGRVCRVRCGAGDDQDGKMAAKDAVCLRPLAGEELRSVLIHIAQRRERSLPVTRAKEAEAEGEDTRAASGWQVRYYYVAFGGDVATRVRITDVGVSTVLRTYLGAVHVHSGAERLLQEGWPMITDADFH